MTERERGIVTAARHRHPPGVVVPEGKALRAALRLPRLVPERLNIDIYVVTDDDQVAPHAD
jgi:hypothetical protein